ATMGINLIAGRDFLPDEYQNFEDVSKGGAKEKAIPVILTQATAAKMEPNGSALGKTYYMGKQSLHVVGIVDTLSTPNGWNDN
ncbi:ABC transporter permease, partial [Gulbenkiania mobilis]